MIGSGGFERDEIDGHDYVCVLFLLLLRLTLGGIFFCPFSGCTNLSLSITQRYKVE